MESHIINIPRSIGIKNQVSSKENERRILILGNSGNGKSASANTIIGKKVFESRPSTQSVTRKCQFHIMKNSNDRQLLIVDTPTLFGSSVDEYSMWEMSKIVGITYPGFDVMIVVVKIGRFTEQEKVAFQYIKRLFGSDVYNRVIILFTGLDNLDADGMEFNDYVNNHIRSDLKHLIHECGKRVVGFNNRADETTRNGQVKVLLDMVECVVESNVHVYPTYNSIELAKLEEYFDFEIEKRTNPDPYSRCNSKRKHELQNEIKREIENENEISLPMLRALTNHLNMIMNKPSSKGSKETKHNGPWAGRLIPGWRAKGGSTLTKLALAFISGSIFVFAVGQLLWTKMKSSLALMAGAFMLADETWCWSQD